MNWKRKVAGPISVAVLVIVGYPLFAVVVGATAAGIASYIDIDSHLETETGKIAVCDINFYSSFDKFNGSSCFFN